MKYNSSDSALVCSCEGTKVNRVDDPTICQEKCLTQGSDPSTCVCTDSFGITDSKCYSCPTENVSTCSGGA